MCGEVCPTKNMEVDVQENGIIRLNSPGHPLHGYIIARLNKDTAYADLPENEWRIL